MRAPIHPYLKVEQHLGVNLLLDLNYMYQHTKLGAVIYCIQANPSHFLVKQQFLVQIFLRIVQSYPMSLRYIYVYLYFYQVCGYQLVHKVIPKRIHD